VRTQKEVLRWRNQSLKTITGLRYLLSILVTLSVSSEIDSQIINSIGIESGISIANLKTNNSVFLNKIGADIFLVEEGPSNKHISLVTIFGYVPKGYRVELKIFYPSYSMEGTYYVRYNFFSFSPMVKGRVEFGHIIPYLCFGPRFDFLHSYEDEVEFLHTFPIDYNEFIIGLNLGLGMEYKFKSAAFYLLCYYQPDLSPIYLTEGPYDTYNKAFIVNLGLKYYFKAKKVQEAQ
jgi:hypothetical protein